MARGGKAFLANRVEHYPGKRARGVLAGDADRELRDSKQEVDRPVEGVYHPAERSVAAGTPFLPNERVLRPTLGQHGANRRLGGEIGIGYQVGRCALGVHTGGDLPEPRPKYGRSCLGGFLRDSKERRLVGLGHDPVVPDAPT